jgi:regulator of protease activity HflC (stomatin/prohibitin superfamily)
MYRLNTRVITVDVPPQDVITKDNVTLKVTAVVFFHIISPRVRTLESGEKGGKYHDWTGSFDTTYSVWRSLLRERLAFPEGITVPIVRTGNTVDRGHK